MVSAYMWSIFLLSNQTFPSRSISSPMEEDGFTLVTNKKRKFKKSNFVPQKGYSPHDLAEECSGEELRERIDKCSKELSNSPFLKEIDVITEKLQELQPRCIVCYALGKLDSLFCQAPKYQLATLLHIKHRLSIDRVQVYDPVLTELELRTIEGYGIERILFNEEGKRRVEERTLFVVFHGEKFIFQNLINTNKDCNRNLIILGNELRHVLEDKPEMLVDLKCIKLVDTFYRKNIFDCCALQWFEN